VDIVGAEALDAIRRYNFTKVFLGTSGVSLSQGFTTPDPEEAAVKALAASRAQEVFVVADSSKFGRVTAAVMFSIGSAVIITDRLPDPGYREYTDIREV
jgi:DeoR family fructose operon transcriptional repressor